MDRIRSTFYALENVPLGLDVRQRELDLPVDTARSDKRWVERLDLVGGHDDLHVAATIETIKLVEELQHRALNFTFTA